MRQSASSNIGELQSYHSRLDDPDSACSTSMCQMSTAKSEGQSSVGKVPNHLEGSEELVSFVHAVHLKYQSSDDLTGATDDIVIIHTSGNIKATCKLVRYYPPIPNTPTLILNPALSLFSIKYQVLYNTHRAYFKICFVESLINRVIHSCPQKYYVFLYYFLSVFFINIFLHFLKIFTPLLLLGGLLFFSLYFLISLTQNRNNVKETMEVLICFVSL